MPTQSGVVESECVTSSAAQSKACVKAQSAVKTFQFWLGCQTGGDPQDQITLLAVCFWAKIQDPAGKKYDIYEAMGMYSFWYDDFE